MPDSAIDNQVSRRTNCSSETWLSANEKQQTVCKGHGLGFEPGVCMMCQHNTNELEFENMKNCKLNKRPRETESLSTSIGSCVFLICSWSGGWCVGGGGRTGTR